MKKLMVLLSLILVVVCSVAVSAGELKELKVANHIDLAKYTGTWFEIAAFPYYFEKNCVASTATYTANTDGTVDVLNKCQDKVLGGKVRSAHGWALVADTQTNAKLKVSFLPSALAKYSVSKHWPITADYWILEVGPNYEYALVGNPNRHYLWILSRKPQLDKAIIQKLSHDAQEQGFDVSRLQFILQPKPKS